MVKRAMLSIYDLTIVVLYVYQSGCLHEKNGGTNVILGPAAASTSTGLLVLKGITLGLFLSFSWMALFFQELIYSFLYNSQGGWNKQKGGAKVPELINEEGGKE